jgi:hypothetical protein
MKCTQRGKSGVVEKMVENDGEPNKKRKEEKRNKKTNELP